MVMVIYGHNTNAFIQRLVKHIKHVGQINSVSCSADLCQYMPMIAGWSQHCCAISIDTSVSIVFKLKCNTMIVIHIIWSLRPSSDSVCFVWAAQCQESVQNTWALVTVLLRYPNMDKNLNTATGEDLDI